MHVDFRDNYSDRLIQEALDSEPDSIMVGANKKFYKKVIKVVEDSGQFTQVIAIQVPNPNTVIVRGHREGDEVDIEDLKRDFEGTVTKLIYSGYE